MKKFRIYKSVFFYLSILSFIVFFSCKKTEERDILKGGEAIVRVNLKGISFEPEKPKVKAFSSVTESAKTVIPINDKYALEATLTAEDPAQEQPSVQKMAAVGAKENLPSGIKYRMAVYDNKGKFVTQKLFTTGSYKPDDGKDLKLDGGNTYKFVIYSYNTSEAPMEVNQDKHLDEAILGNISDKDLLYTIVDKGISGEETNYLDVVMKHLYSRIDVNINSGELGNISAIEATLEPHSKTNNLKLSDGTLTYGSKKEKVALKFEGLNKAKVTSSVIIASSEVSDGKLTLSSIKIGNSEQKNKVVSGLSITPGVKYNLNLTVKANVIPKKTIMTLGHPWYVPMAGTEWEQSKFFKSTYNFGPNGKVKSEGFQLVNGNGDVQANIDLYKPDIIIVAWDYNLSNAAYSNAIYKFLTDGGKVILDMQTDQRPDKILRSLNILKSQNDIPIVHSQTNYVKQLSNIEHPVTMGPFGDIRNKFIGDDNDDTSYLSPSLIDNTNIDIICQNKDGIIGFVHKKYKLLYWTDGGTMCGINRTSQTIAPFLVDAQGKPIYKTYYNGVEVYNSTLIANTIAWFIRE